MLIELYVFQLNPALNSRALLLNAFNTSLQRGGQATARARPDDRSLDGSGHLLFVTNESTIDSAL